VKSNVLITGGGVGKREVFGKRRESQRNYYSGVRVSIVIVRALLTVRTEALVISMYLKLTNERYC
jgi:hypothetical protein